MKEETIQIIKIVLLITYVALCIGFECLYRDALFTKSLDWELSWQTGSSQGTEAFFKVITKVGQETAIIPLVIVVFLCFPLNKSYLFLSAVIYSTFWDNFLKIIYGNPRPYWINHNLAKACDGGFGNPSGHSFSSMTGYLSFWHIVTDFPFFQESILGIAIRIFLLVLFLLLIVTIVLSRIFLGVHSVNQIIYGLSLGFAVYYLFFHIISLHKFTGKKLCDMFTNIKVQIFFGVKYFLYLVIILLLFLLVHNATDKWDPNQVDKCDEIALYRRFNQDGLFGALTLFALIGGHYGLVFLFLMSKDRYIGKEEEINFWYRGSCLHFVYKILMTVAFLIPIVLAVAISKNANLGVIFIFKVALPYIVAVFDIYGPCIFVCLLLKIGNPEIYFTETNKGLCEDIENHSSGIPGIVQQSDASRNSNIN